jgi:DNA repair protein RecN (Recombination protein N)
MSGQFEQRRLARASYQLDVLDSYCGDDSFAAAVRRLAWRAPTARKRHDELTRGAAAEEERLRELTALVEATEGFEPGWEDALRTERERLRHVTELADGAQRAAEALAPEDGEGAAALTATAERSLAPLERLAPELARAGEELRDIELRLRELGTDLRGFLASLEAEPDRVEQVESDLERISDTRRRFGAADYDDLLGRAAAARRELEALAGGLDPAAAAAEALASAEAASERLAATLRAQRGRNGAVRRRSRRGAARRRHRVASFASSCASVSRPVRYGRVDLSRPAERRPSVRPCRGNRLRW